MSNNTKDECVSRDKLVLEPIIGRMRAEGAHDVSDDEIERTLRDCVSGRKLIAIARRLRDAGLLTPADVNLADDCQVAQVAPDVQIGRIATDTESARLTARTGSASDRFAHPVQGDLL